MEAIRIEEACRQEQFEAMSRIVAMGWRVTYVDAVPADFMAREVTDHRWVERYRDNYLTGRARNLLLYANDIPVACATCGPARTDAGPQAGSVCVFQNEGYEGWGEVISFYTHPDHTGKGYGSLLMEGVLNRLREDGFSKCYVLVLRENEGARRFYARHGFAWNGTHEDIPFPPDAICVDLRYVREL